MKVIVKLYASLSPFLPPGAVKNVAEIEAPEGATPNDIMERLNLPVKVCKLVLVNGIFVPPGERTTRALEDGDALAVWPPVAGG
ncbi:MAG: MoaD/ThiS family protein [Alphaproteobacteria bacterium]